MTPSDPMLPLPPRAGAGFAPPPATRLAVPVDVAQRTSLRTVTLELLGLLGVGSGLAVAVLTGTATDVIQLWFGLAAIVFRLVSWWFRTYTVTDGELLLDEGILQKRHRVVPFSRIQQVELRQQLLARLLGVAIVQVETAGDASSTAVVLRFVGLAQAEALRDHLLAQQRRARGSDETEPAAGPGDLWRPAAGSAPVPLAHLRPAQLLLAGATSGTVVGLGALVSVGVAISVAADGAANDISALLALGRWAGITAAILVALAVVVALSTLLGSWSYDLVVAGDDLHVHFGLLDRRQHTIPRHRLQHVTVVDNPVRRRFGIATVRLHSGATPGRRSGQTSHIEIPLIRTAALDALLILAMGDDRWHQPALTSRSGAARRRGVVRRTVPCVALGALGAAAWWPAGAALAPLALGGVPWGLLAHRRAGWSTAGPVLGFSSGALIHRVELIPRDRVQSTHTTASPFQRRVGLCTLHVDVAGGFQHPLRGGSGLMDLEAPDAERAAAEAAGHR